MARVSCPESHSVFGANEIRGLLGLLEREFMCKRCHFRLEKPVDVFLSAGRFDGRGG